jgi:hypothetical protein
MMWKLVQPRGAWVAHLLQQDLQPLLLVAILLQALQMVPLEMLVLLVHPALAGGPDLHH